MQDKTEEIIQKLIRARNDEELIEILKEQRHLFFYRIGVLDSERRLLYDSHTKRLLGPIYFPLQFVTHPEIEEALEYGIGYSEDYSYLLGQKLIYVAKRFDFHNKPYVLRLAFPFQYIQDLRENFTIGFLIFGSIVLILFSVMTGLVLNHFSSPIREIIKAIRGFQEGNLETLPNITLKADIKDDFGHLAHTINSLSQQLKFEIQNITQERNDRDAILEALSDGVIAIDPHNRISYINKNALILLEVREEFMQGLFPRESLPKCFELIENCRKENSLKSHLMEIGYGADRRFLHLIALPRVADGNVILVIQDISLQQKVLEMRKAFIANASHELKTPITVIRGFAETLQDNLTLPQSIVEQILEKIVSNCIRMTKTVKNLLTLADIENLPAFRVTPTDLYVLLMKLRESMAPIYPDLTIEITEPKKGGSFIVDVDEELIEVAFYNLIDNAAKYSGAPALLNIALMKKGSYFQVSFQDNGFGIAESDIKNIFQRFYRVNKAYSKKLGGSGLGLSIVETIISKHLGTISVDSTIGAGSTFAITIPLHLKQLLLQNLQDTEGDQGI